MTAGSYALLVPGRKIVWLCSLATVCLAVLLVVNVLCYDDLLVAKKQREIWMPSAERFRR